MRRHPELAEREMLLSNMDRKAFGSCAYGTKRMGQIAYDVTGKPISGSGLYPVFVSVEDYDNTTREAYARALR